MRYIIKEKDMKDKILKNLSYIFCTGLGLFTFILFAFPYLKLRLRDGIFTSVGGTANGYNVLAMFDYEFAGVMCSILQILVLLLAVLMLAYGIIGLVFAFVKDKKNPIKIGIITSHTLSQIGMLIYSALNAIILIFLIVVCVDYNQAFIGRTGVGLIPSAGIYFAMFVPIASYFALKFFGKPEEIEIEEEPEEEENEEGLTIDDIIPTAQNLKK